jgi:uncharacterized membrane protein YjgN (DUF898 family)
MLVWAVCTILIIVGAADFLTVHALGIFDPFLFVGGWVIIILNEVSFGAKKEQLEVDRDETIKRAVPSMVLAICPQCKSRIPSTSKYCPECGTDLITPA